MKSVPRFTPLKYTTRPATRTISVGNITCIFQRKLKPVESNRIFLQKHAKQLFLSLKSYTSHGIIWLKRMAVR